MQPSRTIKFVPCQAAAGWRGIVHQGGKDEEKKNPLARQRRTSRPRLAECTVSDGLCEESKEKSMRPSRSIKCVPCQAAAGWRGVAHKGGKDLQSVPYWTASVRRVNKGQRDQQVQSSGDRVRRRLDGEVEPIKAAKKWNTYSVYRIGRPL
jgi:hypothetical protein